MQQDNVQGREYLKSKFENGDRPDGKDFADLIDSSINQKSDQFYAVDHKIGIGTERPKAPLEIKGGRRRVKQSFISSNGDCSTVRIAHPEHHVAAIGANNGEKLCFGTFAEDGSDFKHFMALSSDGSLGIGTDTPRQKLDINGSINVSNTIHLSDCVLEFINGRLILTSKGRSYKILMEHIHHDPKPPRNKALMWVLISLGILVVIGLAIVIYLLLTSGK